MLRLGINTFRCFQVKYSKVQQVKIMEKIRKYCSEVFLMRNGPYTYRCLTSIALALTQL